MFQDFYRKADSQISTHIAALASKISREKPSKLPKKDPGQGEQRDADGLREISDRKRARRMLEQKRVALEEAVERAVCEKRSTSRYGTTAAPKTRRAIKSCGPELPPCR